MTEEQNDVAQQVATGGISRRNVLTGVAWGTPAILVATSAPAIAASGGPQAAPGNTPPTQTAAALIETNMGGGSGWSGPPSNVTLQLGYRLAIPSGWPPAMVVSTAWTFTLRNSAGAVVGTASGTAALSAASSHVNVVGTIQVTATGTYSATYVVTAMPYQSGGVNYLAANLISQAPFTVQVDRLTW